MRQPNAAVLEKMLEYDRFDSESHIKNVFRETIVRSRCPNWHYNWYVSVSINCIVPDDHGRMSPRAVY